jgi:predicted P-loop ATPase
MTAAELAPRLHGVRKSGSGFVALCPAHEDENPSLSVNDGEKGLLLKCHAGCPLREITAALGLSAKDLFNSSNGNGSRNSHPTAFRRVVATYPYHDESGTHLFDVVRFDPKGFAQRHADGKWSMDGVRRVLYRLPEVLKATDVLVVEGEKDVDNLREIGLTATCNPGGAGKWRDEYSAFLSGRNVTIIPDNDDVGRKHAESVAASLHGRAATVRVLRLDQGKDVSDWLAAGGNVEQLRAMIEGAPEYRPAAGSNPNTWNLDRNSNGEPAPNLNNAVTVLELDPKLKGRVWYDTFLNRLLTGEPAREWTDVDDIELTLYMQRETRLVKMGKETVQQGVRVVAEKNKRNCAREYLDALKWDGVGRIDHFFEDHFGVSENEYTRAVSKNFWISMAARIYRPGCKCDNMIVLEGAQGIGKSSALEAVGGPFYCEQHESATNPKAFAEILQGKALIEISELDAFSRAEENRVKQVITTLQDRYRTPYDRYAADHPRQCVLAGTTNRNDWGRDETGMRRFWPIECRGQINVPAIRANRDQLFAEAVARFNAGETWWEMPDVTVKEQEQRRPPDVWEQPIADYVNSLSEVSLENVMTGCLKIELGKITQPEQKRAAKCLRAIGWDKKRTRDGRLWVRRQDDE